MEKKLDHLKFYINYTQNRINLLDTKCSILVAVETAFIASVTFIVNQVFSPSFELNLLGYSVIALGVAFSCIIMLFLLNTIRPSKCFFNLGTNLLWKESEGILWPGMKRFIREEEFSTKVDSLNEKLLASDFEAMAYNLYMLIFEKYKYYRIAVWLIKIQVTIVIIATFLICTTLLACKLS